MELFNTQNTRDFTNDNISLLNKEISSISDSEILSLDINELADYYYSKYSIDTITLLKKDISSTIEETKIEEANPFYNHYSTINTEPPTFFTAGYKINYKIPFNGDTRLLHLKPTMCIMARFQVDCVENIYNSQFLPSICFSINIKEESLKGRNNPQEIIDNTFDKEFNKYETVFPAASFDK